MNCCSVDFDLNNSFMVFELQVFTIEMSKLNLIEIVTFFTKIFVIYFITSCSSSSSVFSIKSA